MNTSSGDEDRWESEGEAGESRKKGEGSRKDSGRDSGESSGRGEGLRGGSEVGSEEYEGDDMWKSAPFGSRGKDLWRFYEFAIGNWRSVNLITKCVRVRIGRITKVYPT